MDDPLLVRVLHRVADGEEELQSLARAQPVVIAGLGDRHALDQFHDEVGPTALRRPGIVDLGDVGVVHQRQRLPLGLEPGDHLLRVHPRLDDLQGHPPAHGPGLLGDVDDAHPPLADRLHQPVRPDDGARAFDETRKAGRDRRRRCRGFEEAVRLRVEGEQMFDPSA
jgi:hypothetical protein